MWRFYCLLVLSFLVFLSYFIVPRLFPDIPLENLWGGISNPALRYVYVASMLLAALSFLVLLGYAYGHLSQGLWVSMIGLLVFSLLWMPLMFLSFHHPTAKGMMIAVLGIIAAFAAGIVFSVSNTMWPWIAALYLFLHTFLLDFVLFSLSL